ncbi:carbamoyltransferase HypF [Denitratisoma oestradiolicum]|uniref:Carbamoyltransferase HypF n=1 Tax=Denitratisoma oestradiolicum TaxID=311182 RepID=A0A6S6YA14_9PROT|nr:carbamoyltransferase HypF [Denitratisoma oestradiolicum]TWO79050.1 carbamoyltransferase HypF [Denitratisoma oestradiolicum]CAB1369422.1 Carbamoyltransferase HypF2 [Denitratisoma oestradiolicum]
MRTGRSIHIRGLVQGVGFRPFVWHLARELGLAGWVRNDAAGVHILAEGPDAALDALISRLQAEAPLGARVDQISTRVEPATGHGDFRIVDSGGGAVQTVIGPDTATCGDCLRELFDPADRRWRHPFITCTHCGPRYSLTRRLPYDRAHTSMAGFALCADCTREYTDPADRRFHAEPICCPACGPRLGLLDGQGRALAGDPIAVCLERLRAGDIVAIKGLGGFHLACDARNGAAVARLRLRKNREQKPFALMAANAASLVPWAQVDASALALLESPERPVVLLPKGAELEGLAPGLVELGAMLPCTPIQFLLFHEAAGRPAGMDWLRQTQPLLLVMTSANPGGEPLVIDNQEALACLQGIADALLLHDRDILVRCDDSVLRAGRTPAFIRRARGYTPSAIRLPRAGPSVLALGGGLKNTVCLTRGDEAFVSQHLGDQENVASYDFFEQTVAHLLSILEVEPAIVAHDLHPDFHATRYALDFAAQRGIPALAVQHHQAHLAAIAAEHGHEGPLLGLALDGMGLGSDGQAWGGELLLLEVAGFSRLGHLETLPLPGGDRAAREPWRLGAAALHRLGRGDEIPRRFADRPLAPALAALLQQGRHCPETSSLGRVFDAAAALLGVALESNFEGQAAMLLEARAVGHGDAPAWDDAWHITTERKLDLLPLLARLADWTGTSGEAAARFHASLGAALAQWLLGAAQERGLSVVALGGGCLLNRILALNLVDSLENAGLTVLRARQLPPGDGGISLGQAWVARQKMEY